MDNVILCYVDFMGFTQRVQMPNGEEINLPSETFAESVVALCDKESINKIHLFGNVHYLDGVTEQIERKEKELFSKNNIEIEVN